MKTVKLSGRNAKLLDNPHVFEQCTQYTDLLLVDDCDQYLNLGPFYDIITSDLTVNPKNNHVFTIGYEDAPKIALTTNYVPKDFDPSTEARSLYMVFSDWYHQKTEDNDYRETRSISDDLAKLYTLTTTARTSGMLISTSGCSAAVFTCHLRTLALNRSHLWRI